MPRHRAPSERVGVVSLLALLADDIDGSLEELPVDLVGVIKTLVRGPIVYEVEEVVYDGPES